MEVFPKRKELANAQTAFRSSRKNHHFSSRSSTKCRNLIQFVQTNFASHFKVNTHFNERSKVKSKIPASLFGREAEVLFGALKTKSCLSVASSFSFFLLLLFLLHQGKRKVKNPYFKISIFLRSIPPVRSVWAAHGAEWVYRNRIVFRW